MSSCSTVNFRAPWIRNSARKPADAVFRVVTKGKVRNVEPWQEHHQASSVGAPCKTYEFSTRSKVTGDRTDMKHRARARCSTHSWCNGVTNLPRHDCGSVAVQTVGRQRKTIRNSLCRRRCNRRFAETKTNSPN